MSARDYKDREWHQGRVRHIAEDLRETEATLREQVANLTRTRDEWVREAVLSETMTVDEVAAAAGVHPGGVRGICHNLELAERLASS